jgi:hypothetical protein
LQQSIILRSDAGDREASAALANAWKLVMKEVTGEGVDPVPLVVDWDKFWLELGESVDRTAYMHIVDWVNPIEEPDKL